MASLASTRLVRERPARGDAATMAKHEERTQEDRGQPDNKKGTQSGGQSNDPDKPDRKHGK
ncbi:hypothetical protein [Amycolatopsis sp. NPDC059021]|uniref:hypothetical protein n=1 Tax=Amycolatopsis sp. NPDC059021 TaxID=3346704 RepID=UPI00366F3909